MIKSKFLTIIKIRFIIKLIAKKQKVFAIVFLRIDTDVCLEGQDTLKDLMLNINKNPLGYILGDILFCPQLSIHIQVPGSNFPYSYYRQ